jgi:hypothetical protein
MASLDEVYGGKYGSKDYRPKIYNSPNRRTEGALESNSKLVQDLAKSLPISKDGNSDDTDNYAPVKFEGAPQSKNQREPFYTPPVAVQNYTPPPMPSTHNDYAYPAIHSGRNVEWERRVDKILRRMDSTTQGETSTHDLVLYIFTGVFFLFVLDTFVHIGKRGK